MEGENNHAILRNDVFRVLKQHGILKVLGDHCVVREQGTGTQVCEILCKLALANHPQNTHTNCLQNLQL